MTYILDPSPEKKHVVDFIADASGMDVADCTVFPYVKDRPLEERVMPSVERWLAGFVDSDFVITDSFHGCVLAILMHKRFIAVANCRRGMSRLSSLLSMTGLDQRLVHGIDPEDDGEFFLSEPDWDMVDKVLNEKRAESLDFLKGALNKKR